MRTSLSALLPALWLLAWGHCFSVAQGACVKCSLSAAGWFAEGGQDAPVKHAWFSDQSARWLHRRVGLSTDPDGLSVWTTAVDSKCSDLSQAKVVPLWREVPLSLAQSWQFFWRTAPQPRAPAAVS